MTLPQFVSSILANAAVRLLFGAAVNAAVIAAVVSWVMDFSLQSQNARIGDVVASVDRLDAKLESVRSENQELNKELQTLLNNNFGPVPF